MANVILLVALLSLAINCNLTNAIALHCKFEMVSLQDRFKTIPPDVAVYACSATTLIETQNNDRVIAIYGTHASGKGNGDVLGLTILSQNMGFFPTNIEEFFPNVRVIDFSSNSISSVNNGHLRPFPNLSHLSLADNRISVLDRNLFSGLSSFWYLILSENGITSIDSNLFAGLNSGSFIDLSNNSIRHVGHEFIVPKLSNIQLVNNICVDTAFYAASDEAVEEFKFDLLKNCPPTITLIESTLESRPNFIKDLLDRVANLERIIENNSLKVDKPH